MTKKIFPKQLIQLNKRAYEEINDPSLEEHSWMTYYPEGTSICLGCGLLGIEPLTLQCYGYCSGDPEMPYAP